MAIDIDTADFILSARRAGAEFTKSLTLGRQTLFVDRNSLRACFKRHGAIPSDFDARFAEGTEGLFSLLGAKVVESLDASAFEGATIVHDLNEPIDPAHKKKYDCVFDGGTLEHVFNFPIALRNAMEAVKIGGHLILHTPINNYCGHGFYQFCPELFYRTLSEVNGYKIERMIAFSIVPGAKWFEVSDPAKCGGRIEIRHDADQVLLLVLAKRTHDAEIFKTTPQQSDYVALWNKKSEHDSERTAFSSRLINSWRSGWLPYAISIRILASMKFDGLVVTLRNRRHTRRHQPQFFRPIKRERNPKSVAN